ncbi:hypothetical protein SAMN05428988_6144 [Chitinophaga sp. YR573]|nr:hypothetical protein SAMN05428988_6144 [Chitinophaga sp. YR573]
MVIGGQEYVNYQSEIQTAAYSLEADQKNSFQISLLNH